MLEDAMNGKFELLVTREVCRFARNTVDSLNYVRLLSTKNVEVFFVNDGIWSMDTDGELRLTIFSALAQDESRKISERVKAGQLVSRSNNVLYGFNAFGYNHVKGEKSSESHYIINAEEAETVRLIFELYLKGFGMKAICARLIKDRRKNASGLVKFDPTLISRILGNKLYAGYITYNKSYKEDFLGKRIFNKDPSTYLYVKSDKIEPIITEEEYDQVQELKRTKRKYDHGKGQCKRAATDRYVKKLVCSCGQTYKRFKWRMLQDGTKVYGYQCRNIVNNHSSTLRAENGLSTEGFCSLPGIAQWKLDFMLSSVVNELWEKPSGTVKKLLSLVEANYTNTGENEIHLKRISLLQAEVEKITIRKQNLDMKWLDGKLSDSDRERLCQVLDNNIETYQKEITALTELVDSVPDTIDLDTKMNNIRFMEQLLIDNSNITQLHLDDAFIDTFIARIVPCEGRKFKWYVNIGTGKGWSFFSESAYELYDYYSLTFEQARRYRKSKNQYLRQNQWEDLKVEIHVRTI
jgi:DNA invertase Pin-like site-specific DNA recombinase